MNGGLVLHGRYRLLERLAVGGMGEVWRASDDATGRLVAVKLLRREFGSDATARGRFAAEARFAAELRHPGIARAFDFGEQDDRAFLVMELVAGEPLDRILARDGGLPLEAVLDLLAQAGRALTVAHRAGVVHRDVKPANLMVSPDGILKITDFGIARQLAAASQTATGMVMGTAHYISPEQAQGLELSPAADLYSLGVVAYECLTGAPPFDGSTPVEVALRHVREAPAELPARFPVAARDLIMEMLAKRPTDRPADAATVAERALEIRASLASGRMPRVDVGGRRSRPTVVTQSTTLSGFDASEAMDTLASRPWRGQHRLSGRPVMTYTSVAAVLLVVCVVMAGSLWRGFNDFSENRHDPPGAPATRPVGDGTFDNPVASPGGAARHWSRTTPRPTVMPRQPTRRIRPSTPGTSEASPTQRTPTKPPGATPTAPEPTPTLPENPRTPSTPSPDPSPTESGKLGSGDKV
ncbi:serine/threonine-protein kinase [Actinomadura pelletieri DSM 43383]|uniref:non-specific serine/threonine protein kinase n=1 Tax=Actinomadura pelletieri DSM 43383 TaxID=1120940 RepID=A0A495QYM4_9ACTN|nr:serine/threonine-protein kinase [Actinomadura pelletieri]RKS79243.1 serine/threonine-protein kinase [Actinomadura pelletieri DSM 43383]